MPSISVHRKSLRSLWVLALLVACAPVSEPEGGAQGVGVDSPVPAEAASILTEGRFAGFSMGDYAHLSVERTLGPDCDFWGVGGAEPSVVDRLETDPALLGQRVVVAHDRTRRFVPEAQEELLVAQTHSFTSSGDGRLSSDSSSPVARTEAVRRAASAYVTDVSGVDGALRIEDVGLSGDEAVAVAIYGGHPMPDWSHSWVLLERRADGWRGVGYGSGLQPPAWYLCSAEAAEADDDAGTSWAGSWFWEEDGVRHGGGEGIYSTVVWTLELGPEGRGRLSVDGFQTFEEYAVELIVDGGDGAGDGDTARVVLADVGRPRAGTTLAPGDTLVTLYRPGHKLLTRLGRLGPRLEPEGDVWAVRFRR